jgi:hypothetical protein
LTAPSMDPLSALLAGSVDLLDIPPSVRDAAVARYEDVGNFLADTGGSRCGIYPQGSFLIGTAICPPSDTEYDIDLVFQDDIDKDQTTQAELKERVGDMLEAYNSFKAGAADGPDDFFEKRRCWTLSYEQDGFHLDVLPAIPNNDPASPSNAILLTDTKLRPWQHGNPKDYAVWFRRRSEEMLRRIEAKARAENVDDIPNWAVRSTLQRVVQVLKWHCYSAFANDIDNRPPSILITTLAAWAYRGQENLGTALLEVIDGVPNYIDTSNGRWEVLNPAHKQENFTDKWNEPDTAHRRGEFERWLKDVQRDLELAHDSQNAGIDVLVDRLGTAFDRNVLVKSASNWAKETLDLRTSGKLTVAQGSAALGIGMGRASPRHAFYGHETR